jgi:hypothetical protein
MKTREHKSGRGNLATVKRRTRKEVRTLFCSVLAHAVDESGLSRAATARHLGIAPITLRGWLSGKHAISLETLACSLRLWPHFARCLLVLERKARVI